jgi:hypothetical protein
MHYVNSKFHKSKSYRRSNMKKVFVVALAVVLGAAFVTTVFAQKMTDTAITAESIAKGKSGKFAGEVVSVDTKANSAVFKGKFGEKTGMLAYAKFEGEYKAAADLKPGDKVVGLWQTVQGNIYITRIAMAPAKADKPAAKPAAKPADTAPKAAPAPAPAPAPAK